MNIFIVIVGLAALAECVTPKTTTTENYGMDINVTNYINVTTQELSVIFFLLQIGLCSMV